MVTLEQFLIRLLFFEKFFIATDGISTEKFGKFSGETGEVGAEDADDWQDRDMITGNGYSMTMPYPEDIVNDEKDDEDRMDGLEDANVRVLLNHVHLREVK